MTIKIIHMKIEDRKNYVEEATIHFSIYIINKRQRPSARHRMGR